MVRSPSLPSPARPRPDGSDAPTYQRARWLKTIRSRIKWGRVRPTHRAIWQEPKAGGAASQCLQFDTGSLRRGDSPPPAVLRVGPTALLHLQPAPRRASLVQTRLVLRDVTLAIACDHLRPCLEPVWREASHRKHEIGVSDDIFQPSATFAQWASSQPAGSPSACPRRATAHPAATRQAR